MEPQRRIKIRGGGGEEEERKIREEYLRYSISKKLVLSEQQKVQRSRNMRRIIMREREIGLSEQEEEEEGRELQIRCLIRRRKREREREEEELRKRNLLLLEECVLSDHTAHVIFLLVLYRLPVESIFIFKSVSKSCLAMISHPNFARSYSLFLSRRRRRTIIEPTWTLLYGKHSPSSSSASGARLPFIIAKPVFKAPSFKFKFLSSALKAQIKPLAASNGLILTTTTSNGDCYYICNPLTQQWTALPKTPRVHQSVSLGFIVEPYGGNFQLLRIGGFEGKSNILNFEIFSSKTRQWKEKSVSFDHQVTELVSTCHAVTCNQILYWMDCNKIVACDSSQSDNDSHNDETIRWWQIDLPSDRVIHGSEIMGMIGVCQDKLRYFHSADGIENISIWELRKYRGEEEWILLHRIRYGEVSPAPLRIVQPLAFHPFYSDLVYLYSSGSLVSLNLRSKVVKNCIRLEGISTWWTVLTFVLPTWPTPVPQISPTPV